MIMYLIPLLLVLTYAGAPTDYTCPSSESTACGVNRDAVWARSRLPHPVTAPVAPSLPRIAVNDLDLPQNVPYKNRISPFILTDAMDGWKLLDRWPMDRSKPPRSHYLAQVFPQQVCDFYPYNMLQSGTHPFLIRFRRGLQELLQPSSHFGEGKSKEYACDDQDGCRYLHMQLVPETWDRLEKQGDLPKKRHFHVESDRWWMRRCFDDPEVAYEYHIKTHWKIVLIGTQGSGMFNHSDTLMSSSWHGHVQGSKWWYVCSPEGADKQECFESILEPGEVLYYGAGWYHTTRNLDNPSMTITGTVVTRANFEGVADKLWGECTSSSLGFQFSSRLCDALDQCYGVWHKYLTGHDKPERRWKPWRSVASDDTIKAKSDIHPLHNNYDGRNFITE